VSFCFFFIFTVHETGKGTVAAELGICIDTLRSWLKAAGAPSPGQADRQNRDARRLRELEAEIRALRKKLEEKDGVIDILKKSVGILSKP
ncbi:MAG: transposase, partial [Ruthenibacterium lactatiformans]